MNQIKKMEAYNKYFEYITTGDKPSTAIKKLAKEFGVSERSIYSWRSNYRWDEKCTERSIKLNKELARDIENQADQVVKDFKKPFISILNRLIKQCVHNHQVEIKTTKELVTVMEMVVKLQKELNLNHVNIISSEYSRDKHTKAINAVLKELQQESISESTNKEKDILANGLQTSENIQSG